VSLYSEIDNALFAERFGSGMLQGAAMQLADRFLPSEVANVVNRGGIQDAINGNYQALGGKILDQFSDSLNLQQFYWGTPTALFGGVTPAEALRIYMDAKIEPRAKKNLFLIEVSSVLLGDVSHRFNLFCTELDYAPLTIGGEKHKIGAAHTDSVNSSDPVELRITTTDNQDHYIKRWFQNQCCACAASDGTVGLPADYAVTIKILHSKITRESSGSDYEDVGLFRPANMEIQLSRREDALQELTLSFVQLDTFMAA
jgi:hypothetical protein